MIQRALLLLLVLSAGCSSTSHIEPARTSSSFDVRYDTFVDVGRPSEAAAPVVETALVDEPALDVRATFVAIRRDLARDVLRAPDDGLFAHAVDGAELERLVTELDDRTASRFVTSDPIVMPCDGSGEVSSRYPSTYVRGWHVQRDTEPAPDEGSVELGYSLDLDSTIDEAGDLALEVSLQRASRPRPWPEEKVRLPGGEERSLDIPVATLQRITTTARLPREGGGLILGGLAVPKRDEWIVAFVHIGK